MAEIKRCARCILPTSLPSVKLDNEEICNYCRNHEKMLDTWEKTKSKRKEEFEALIQRVKQLNRPYDCLIPLSGGKDSTYALYVCSKMYGLKCLCVTFDNGFLSDYAKSNISNAIEKTGADHIYYRIDRALLLQLYKLFLLKTGQFCPVCMRGIELSTEYAAKIFKVPLIVYGTGERFTYLGFIPEIFQAGDVPFIKEVLKGEPLAEAVGPMTVNLTSTIKRVISFSFRLLKIRNFMTPQRVGLYDYIEANYDAIYTTITQEMGWKKPENQFEHMDCLLHELPFYMHTLKFPELSKDTLYHSGLIRLGRMTREEAINRINNKQNERPAILDSFLEELEMSNNEFEESIRDWRKIERYRKK